jgi:hypothetical protein
VTDYLDPVALRDIYDTQLRARLPDRPPPMVVVETDGPLLRVAGLGGRGFVTYMSVAGVDDLDELIARQRDHFAALGRSVEWKAHGHDEPADLPERLVRAGFVPEEQETVVIGLAAPLAAQEPSLPRGVRLREVTSRTDLDQIAAMHTTVWGSDHTFLADELAEEIAADPAGTTIVVAETNAETDAVAGDSSASSVSPVSSAASPALVVSAGWVRFVAGTAFATLWGGSTLPQWRGRGIYRALVAYRAWLAISRGFTYVQVDASDDSRPILGRAGFVEVTTTTPYVYRPAAT